MSKINDPYAHRDGSRECRPATGPFSHSSKLERMTQELAAAGEPDFEPRDETLRIVLRLDGWEARVQVDVQLLKQADAPAALLGAALLPFVAEMLRKRKSK